MPVCAAGLSGGKYEYEVNRGVSGLFICTQDHDHRQRSLRVLARTESDYPVALTVHLSGRLSREARDPICQEPRQHGNIFPVAELVVEGDQLVLRLSWWEKIAAVHGNVRVPLASVSSVHVEARAADALRSPMFKNQSGTGAFIDYGYGVRGYGGGFVALRQRRRRPAVQVHLDPPPSRSMRLSALLVTVANPEATAARIIDARLDQIRGANPGWDIRKASPPQIGWIAGRPGERLHAVPLTKLDALLAKRRDGRRR